MRYARAVDRNHAETVRVFRAMGCEVVDTSRLGMGIPDLYVSRGIRYAWVEVKDKGGKVVFSRLGKAGSQEEVVVSAPVSLVVGNARHVKLQRNGTAIDIPTPGKVTVGRLKLD